MWVVGAQVSCLVSGLKPPTGFLSVGTFSSDMGWWGMGHTSGLKPPTATERQAPKAIDLPPLIAAAARMGWWCKTFKVQQAKSTGWLQASQALTRADKASVLMP